MIISLDSRKGIRERDTNWYFRNGHTASLFIDKVREVIGFSLLAVFFRWLTRTRIERWSNVFHKPRSILANFTKYRPLWLFSCTTSLVTINRFTKLWPSYVEISRMKLYYLYVLRSIKFSIFTLASVLFRMLEFSTETYRLLKSYKKTKIRIRLQRTYKIHLNLYYKFELRGISRYSETNWFVFYLVIKSSSRTVKGRKQGSTKWKQSTIA